MRKVQNEETRELIKKSGLRQWEVAQAVGMREDAFSRMIARTELSEEMKERISKAIEELTEE